MRRRSGRGSWFIAASSHTRGQSTAGRPCTSTGRLRLPSGLPAPSLRPPLFFRAPPLRPFTPAICCCRFHTGPVFCPNAEQRGFGARPPSLWTAPCHICATVAVCPRHHRFRAVSRAGTPAFEAPPIPFFWTVSASMGTVRSRLGRGQVLTRPHRVRHPTSSPTFGPSSIRCRGAVTFATRAARRAALSVSCFAASSSAGVLPVAM